MTGRSSKLNETTFGATLSGSWLLMRLIAWVIFCSAVVRSVPYVNDAWMIEAFVVLVALVVTSPGMPWMADSIGLETSLLTTSGEAPGYVVTIESCGNSIEGMSSCLRLVSAIPPKTAATIVMRAMSARFLRLRMARFDTGAFAVISGLLRLIR